MILLTTLVLGGPGCGEGDDIPLFAPGGGLQWPADPGWVSLSPMNARYINYSAGARASQTIAGETEVVLVGREGLVAEYKDGQWGSSRKNGQNSLYSVVSVGGGEFVAVGDGGSALSLEGGTWQIEDTGTTEYLRHVVEADGIVWAVGGRGTVQRREAGQWTAISTGTSEELRCAAVLNDSLFVVGSDREVRVWDGEDWGVLSNVPWASGDSGSIATAVATGDDGRLFVAAGGLYVREASGWRAIGDVALSPYYYTYKLKIIENTVWFYYGSTWHHIDVNAPASQSAAVLPGVEAILLPRDLENYLTVSSGGRIDWVVDGQLSRDVAGTLDAVRDIYLAEGGLIFMTNVGVVQRDATSLKVLVAPDQLPLMDSDQFRAGWGQSPRDFYLAGYGVLYHCVDGVATVVGTWAEDHTIHSLAISDDGVIYCSDYHGLWRWQDGAWLRELPVMAEHNERFLVQSLANGSLVATDNERQVYRLDENGQWIYLDLLTYDSVIESGTDGTLFVVKYQSSVEGFTGGNILLTYDERAGAFINRLDQGMGPLVDLNLEGSENQGGETFIWTTSPTMVFALEGPPANANWRVVAGPLDGKISRLVRLSDGNLLAVGDEDSEFFLYRP